MSRQKLAVTATLFAAGAFATQADAAQTVDITASVGGTSFDVNGNGQDDFTFTKAPSGAVTLGAKTLSGSTVGPVSQAAYFPDQNAGNLQKTQTVTSNGYYGLVFHNDFDPIKNTYSNTYTGYALVDGDGSHISELDFRSAVSSVPEPESWALMILGMGAIGATMRQRRRAASADAALA